MRLLSCFILGMHVFTSVVAFQALQDASCVVSGTVPTERCLDPQQQQQQRQDENDKNLAGSIITVESFFDSATCQKYRDSPLSLPSDGSRNVIGDFIIESNDMEKIVSTFTAMGKRGDGQQRGGGVIHNEDVGILSARHTYIQSSTIPHHDHYAEGIQQGRPVPTGSSNAFIFLNTNPNALFFHGTSQVPVVEGTLVVFDGAVAHHTYVPSGTVHLLGPLNTETLQRVGTAPAPPTTPTTPTPAPPTVPCNVTGLGLAIPIGGFCFKASLFPLGLMLSGIIASLILFTIGARPNAS